MRSIAKFTKQTFEKFTTEPLILHEFDPKSTSVARKHVIKLRKALKDISVDVLHRGSTFFKIVGKGDIDIGIYTTKKTYTLAIKRITDLYFKPQIVGDTFVAFYIEDQRFTIEISLMQGREAVIDKALTYYLAKHKNLLKEYEKLKRTYFYSKRVYLTERNKFLCRVIKEIPE